jgi:CBS-domain-containing membrane protein
MPLTETQAESVDLAAEAAELSTEPAVPTHALRAKDVMSAPVHVISLMDTMRDAWSVMLDSGLRHLVVCDAHRCAGVLDDRMLFAHWPTGPFGVRSTPVRDLMRSRTTCVLPETTLARVARVMVNDGVDAVPVTAVDGTVLGIVTGSDIAAAVARYDLGGHQPEDPADGSSSTKSR